MKKKRKEKKRKEKKRKIKADQWSNIIADICKVNRCYLVYMTNTSLRT